MDNAPMAKRVAVLAANKDAEMEDVRFFLARILDATNAQRKVVVRSVGLLVLLAGLFAVLSGGGLTEAEIFGLKVQRFTFFLLATPVAASFLFLRACANLNAFRMYKTLFFNLTEAFYPTWRESALDALLLSTPDQINGPVASMYYMEGPARKIVSLTALTEAIFLLIAPLAFACYAYFWLFTSNQISAVAVAVSLALSALLLTSGWIQYFVSNHPEHL